MAHTRRTAPDVTSSCLYNMTIDQPPHNLPTQLTPFIGRTEELNDLKNLLGNPDCRLLTLVGPGGSGKTRLAIEGAREGAADFADGVFFVPLQPVGLIEFLVPHTIGTCRPGAL